MINVLLVNPKGDADQTNSNPLGLCYISAALKSDGHNVELVDLHNLHDVEFLSHKLFEKEYDIVGISACAPTIHQTIKLARLSKTISPKSKIILGGHHATYAAKELMEMFTEIDYICIGDGEECFQCIARAVENKFEFHDVPNLVWRDQSEIIFNKVTQSDLSLLPDRSLIENPVEFSKRKELPFILGEIITCKGCTGKCTFCSSNIVKYRGTHCINLGLVENDLKVLRDLNVNAIHIIDSDFLTNSDHALKVIELLKKYHIDYFFIVCRVDSFLRFRDNLDFLFNSGCIGLEIGIESGDPNFLMRYKKGVTIEKNVECLTLLHHYEKKYRFNVTIDFIMFDEVSTLERLKMNYDFLIDNGLNCFKYEECLFNRISVLHGSQIYAEYKREGRIGNDISEPFVGFSDKKVQLVYSNVFMYKEIIHPIVVKLRKILKKQISTKYNMLIFQNIYKLNDYAFQFFYETYTAIINNECPKMVFDNAYKDILKMESRIKDYE